MKVDIAFINFLDMTKLIVQEDTLNDFVKDGILTVDQKKTQMDAAVQKATAAYKDVSVIKNLSCFPRLIITSPSHPLRTKMS